MAAVTTGEPRAEAPTVGEASADGPTVGEASAEGPGADPDATPAEPAPAAAPAAAPDDAAPQGPPIDSGATVADPIATGGIVPGSYLPPSSIHRPGLAAPAAPTEPPWSPTAATAAPAAPVPTWPEPRLDAGPAILPAALPGTPAMAPGAAAATAPAWAAQPVSAPAWPDRSGADFSPPLPSPARPAATVTPGRASILADLPFDAPDDLEGWLVALGGIFGVASFLLPWRSSFEEGLGGYLGSWGLGILQNLPIFVVLVLVTALALLPNRVAAWVRTGVCGMVAGGILFGLVWLYLGGTGAEIGAIIAAVGAVLLVAGGVIAVSPGRRGSAAPD